VGKLKTMKSALLFALSLAVTLSGFSAAPAPTLPAERPKLGVIVIDSLPTQNGFDDFNLIAEEFGNAFNARHWPLDVTFERFAANNEDHPIELKVFNQGIHNVFGERRVRAWVILTVNGTKHDFGIVEYRFTPRVGLMTDDLVHRAYRGEGDKIGQLIEPYLVPTTPTK
jgi:hypothetical protein